MNSVPDSVLKLKAELTEKEMDVVTTVFRSYETGLREATIMPKVIRKCRIENYTTLFVGEFWSVKNIRFFFE